MPENVHLLRVPIPNSPLGQTLIYVIAGPNGHTMIDTGAKSRAGYESLRTQFGDLGLDLNDVRQIILTHMRSDHVGLASQIRTVSGAKVICHESNAPAVKKALNSPPPPWQVGEKERGRGSFLRQDLIPSCGIIEPDQ